MLLYTTAGLAWIRQTGREWCPLECRIVSPRGANLLDYLVRSLHVDGHHSRPFRRLSTIPAVLDIYILPFPRSTIQTQCQKSTWRSRVSSSELDMISHIEIVRAHLSSREIALSTSDTASEWRSVESEVWRYPQRPGSSSFDDVDENGAVRHMGSIGVMC